jgi:hypothetical protein
MRPFARLATLLAVALCAAMAVQAQPVGSRVSPPFVPLGSAGAFERQTVRGTPYSAETETDLVQRLGDGNRITGHWTGFVARDGEGRIRREQPLAAIGPLLAGPDSPRLTVIHDPVERVTWLLDPAKRTARRLPWPENEPAEGAGTPAPTFERPGFGAGTPGFAGGGAVAAEPRTEPLGEREIAGLPVQGTRTSVVVPAGQIGNERPLEISSERWYSSELQVVVETRQQDPRLGEMRFRLTRVDRRQPERELFEVPAGYTVEEGPPPPRFSAPPPR